MYPFTVTRRATLAIAAAAGLVLAGCAGMRNLTSEVSSFGEWPQGKAPGTYAFERLPSQQAQAAMTEAVENSARPALEKAGFKPAEPGREPDVLVQVGARDGAVAPWADPLWWRGSFGYWRYGPWAGPRWSLGAGYGYPYGPGSFPRYEREAALLIRDRATGKPLYETRAMSEGNSRAEGPILSAMFDAALADFPRQGVNPRRVSVPLAQ